MRFHNQAVLHEGPQPGRLGGKCQTRLRPQARPMDLMMLEKIVLLRQMLTWTENQERKRKEQPAKLLTKQVLKRDQSPSEQMLEKILPLPQVLTWTENQERKRKKQPAKLVTKQVLKRDQSLSEKSRTAEMEHLHSSFSAAAFGGKAQATFSASRKRRISSSTPKHGFVQQGQPDWNFLTSSLASDLTGAVPRWDVSSVLPTLCEEDLTSGAMVEGGDSNEIPKVKTSAAPITEEDLRLLHTDYLMARYAEMQMEDLSQRMKNEMRSAMVDVWQQKQEALAEKHRLELLLQRIKQEQQQTTTLNIEKALLIEQVKSLKGGFITSFTECGRALETASHSLPTRNLHGSEEPGYTELLKEQLNAVMNESEQLKDELSSHLSGLQPVTTAASQLRQTTSLLVAEISGLQDCQQQLNDLVLEEASLLLQQEELPE
uniref:uncharacterized protein isoform X4 n=2 Tax=Myxine glutinosa TaxID=7769 RepID=UPI00358FD029